MIWLAWRQQRTETLVAVLLLAALAAVLIPTGLHVASVYDRDGIGACLAHDTGGCEAALNAFDDRFAVLLNLVAWFSLLPGILAILLAAPFVIELEHGTYRLAWTQSITRRRWLTTRLALIVAGALVAALIMTLLLTWWRVPFDRFSGRIDKSAFEFEGLAPFAYIVFAAALVIALGVVLRRTAPAIALALIGFVAARVAVSFLRPHYLAPVTATWSGDARGSGPDLRTAWVISEGLGDGHGHEVQNLPSIASGCGSGIGNKFGDPSCLAQHGVFNQAVYHPASRFWLFQGIEAAIFFGLALAFAGFAAWWVHNRIS